MFATELVGRTRFRHSQARAENLPEPQSVSRHLRDFSRLRSLRQPIDFTAEAVSLLHSPIMVLIPDLKLEARSDQRRLEGVAWPGCAVPPARGRVGIFRTESFEEPDLWPKIKHRSSQISPVIRPPNICVNQCFISGQEFSSLVEKCHPHSGATPG